MNVGSGRNHTSGQVGQKYEEGRSVANTKYNQGEGYDYYHTDSDNDGVADVHDLEDLNPDVQVHERKNKPDHAYNQNQKKKTDSKKIHKTPRKHNADKKKSSEFKSKDTEKTDKQGKKKKSRKKLSQTGSVVIAAGYTGREVQRRFNQLDCAADSDKNSALQASEAGREVSIAVVRKSSSSLKHGLKSRSKKVTSDRHVKESQVRRSAKSKGRSKYYQKQRIKNSYARKVSGGYTQKAKGGLKGIAKKLKEATSVAVKRLGAYAAGIVLAMLMLISTVSAFTGMISNGVSVILSTSYQSDDYEITDTENVYNRMEADLEYAVENVEDDYSGYDEYKYDIDSIGHDPQVLMAYLTAKYGEFTASSVNSELSRIFDDHYDYELTSVTETRTRTITSTTTDPFTGETTTTTHEVEYDWEVLKVSLDTSDFEDVLLSRLDQEEEELYATLMETLGNFPSLPSPLREDWRNAVTSMYGFRLDPFDGHVEFHTGIDIARPVGTELVAVFDGTVTDTGYVSGYGNYIELTNDEGQSVFYAHCNSILVNQGDDVLTGEKVGEMGSTGNSTGSHLHFEVKGSDGNRLNPYFFLSDEIAGNPH